MALRITIVGELQDDSVERDHALGVLRAKTGDADVEWDWVRSPRISGFRPSKGDFNRLRTAVLQAKASGTPIVVVMLKSLNKEILNEIVKFQPESVRAPGTLCDAEELATWALSPEANLVPRVDWFADAREAALFCILAKLIKNKDWNKDTHGHQWTKQADLLGQSPVDRPDHPQVRMEATAMLPQLGNSILLTKGKEQGSTPKEWSINMKYLAAVKQAFLGRSLSPFDVFSELTPILAHVRTAVGHQCRLDEVIGERVLGMCREQTYVGESASVK